MFYVIEFVFDAMIFSFNKILLFLIIIKILINIIELITNKQ